MAQSDAQIIDDDVASALNAEYAGKKDEIDATLTDKKEEKDSSDNELERLRAQLEEERRLSRARDEEIKNIRKYSNETSTRLADETQNRIQAEEVAIANAIAATTTEAERLENEIVAAQEAGRFADSARLTRQLASTQTKIDNWEARKEQFETWKAAQKAAPVQEYKPQTKSQVWLQQNANRMRDPAFSDRVTRTHYLALSEGLVVDTDEYINFINNKVDGKAQERQQDIQQRNRTVESAPPSRGGASMGSNTNKSGESNNRLTKAEAEMATFIFPKLKAAEAQKAYLENKMKAVADGKINGGF